VIGGVLHDEARLIVLLDTAAGSGVRGWPVHRGIKLMSRCHCSCTCCITAFDIAREIVGDALDRSEQR
jgi:hypothetical protein